MVNFKRNRGFTLLEALIAFVILVVGLLGATALVIRSAKTSVSAYEYSQISILSNTFIERVRANSNYINLYTVGGSASAPNATVTSSCMGENKSCTSAQIATSDIAYFNQQLGTVSMPNLSWTLSEEGTDVDGVKENKVYELNIKWASGDYYQRFIIRQKDITAP